jgi:hypothetical protein
MFAIDVVRNVNPIHKMLLWIGLATNLVDCRAVLDVALRETYSPASHPAGLAESQTL